MREPVRGSVSPAAKPSMYRRTLSVAALCVLLSALATIGFYVATTSTISGMVTTWSQQRGQSVVLALHRMGGSLATTTRDYAVWEETYDYVSTRDPDWASSNLQWLIDGLGVSGVAVLALDNTPVFRAGVLAGDQEAVHDRALSELAAELLVTPAAEVLVYDPATRELYWMAGSRIVHGDDGDRTGEFSGFLVLSRVVGPDDIGYIEALTGVTNISVSPPSGPTPGGQQYTVPLTNYLGLPGILIAYDAQPPLLGMQLARWRLGTALSVVVSLAAMAGVLAAFYTMAVRPIRRLTEAVSQLAHGRPWQPPELSSQEFQAISDAISHAVLRQKEAEQAERQRADQLRLLLDNLPAYVFFKDSEGRYLTANRLMLDLLGRQEADVLGKADAELLAPELAAQVSAGDDEVLAKGVTIRGETKLRMDDRCQSLLTIKAPLADPSGGIAGLVGMAFDVSEQRQLAEALRRSQRLETVGQLAGGVAHDFNNVLTTIIGALHLALAQVPQDGQLATDMSDALQAATRASQITRQLLFLSRDQGGDVLPVDVNEAVVSLAKMLRRLLGEDITLELALGADHPVVLVDRTRLEQVVLNLCLNSRDAMRQGGRLTVRTAALSRDEIVAAAEDPASVAAPTSSDKAPLAPGRYLLLSVADTGSGISEEARPRVFDLFFTTKADRGTGLGLTVVQTVVSEYRGRLWFRSTPGEGCTFYVALPICEERVLTARPEQAPSPISGSETILVVEDDEAVRLLTQRVLSRQGYSVLTADSAAAAMQTLASLDSLPTLVLSDIVMPGMNGVEFARELRTRYPSVKVLLTTGYPGDAMAARGLENVPEHVLPKPYSPGALSRAIREAIDGNGGGSEGA